MRKYFLLSLASLMLVCFSCTSPVQNDGEKMADEPKVQKDTLQMLAQYWQLIDADHPTSRDISFKDNKGIQMQSGIVFMTDFVVLENPKGEMSYGKFSLNKNTINVDFDNGRKAVYKIGKLDSSELWLKRVENKKTSELTFKGSNTYWPDASKNPFSKQNYQWAQKPSKAENDVEIRNRLKGCVQFYADYFTGFINGRAKEIDFTDLPSCFYWYTGGIFIQNENKLDNKWINCFYSPEQAFQGRKILQDALAKKYDWDTTQTNWLKQTVPVLEQIKAGL